MTSTYSTTFNREDIRRVYASFAADYRIIAEWTGLHDTNVVDRNISQIGAVAEEQYLTEVHIQLVSSAGAVKDATAYRVSTSASGWTTTRPGDMYWSATTSDRLKIIVFFAQRWWDLEPWQRAAFEAEHMPNWGTSEFNGVYTGMTETIDRYYASRDYGLQRTKYTR